MSDRSQIHLFFVFPSFRLPFLSPPRHLSLDPSCLFRTCLIESSLHHVTSWIPNVYKFLEFSNAASGSTQRLPALVIFTPHCPTVMNKPTFGVLQTGTYLITNVKNGNNAIIANDDYAKAPIISRCDPSAAYSKVDYLYISIWLTHSATSYILLLKWNITLLSNGNYNIVNYKFGNSAATAALAGTGADIVALKTRVQPWVVRETGTNGNYM